MCPLVATPVNDDVGRNRTVCMTFTVSVGH